MPAMPAKQSKAVGATWRRLLVRLVLSAVPLAVFIPHALGTRPLELLTRMENYLYDWRVRATLTRQVDPRIVIVDIDEASLGKIGQWPWPREQVATLVNHLFDDFGVRVVGFDVVFPEPGGAETAGVFEELRQSPLAANPDVARELTAAAGRLDGDKAFVEALIARDVALGLVFKRRVSPDEPPELGSLPPAFAVADPRIAAVDWIRPEGFTGNLLRLQEAAVAGGFFDTALVDSDGVVRRGPLFQSYKGRIYPSLAFAVARLALPKADVRFIFDAARPDVLTHVELGTSRAPVDRNGAVLIPFRGPLGSFAYVSAADVLDGTAPAAALQGAIVLVGTSAPGLLDIRPTPVGQEYVGVETHANVVAGLLDGSFPYRPGNAVFLEVLGLVLLGLLTALLVPVLSPPAGLALAIALGGFAIAAGFVAWLRAGIVIPVGGMALYTAVATLLQLTYGYFAETRRKRRLSRLFSQYVPPEVVSDLDASEAEVSLEGETRQMSVLFSDVRGFTTISEGLSARELTRLMNEFLTPITAVIQGHRGTIDKYMGDAVMAFWGAPLADPEHARHAVESALDMVAAMRALHPGFRARGWPELNIGVGISSGDMNVGNMGSRFRMAYTVLGDTVNLGSRLEGLTKQYGVDVIVSAATAAAVPDFLFRELDLVRVKGKLEPIAIFEPLGRLSDATESARADVQAFGAVRRLYRARQWAAARGALLSLQAANPLPLYKLYLERIGHFAAEPPLPDWDGVFVFQTK
jgi:adenylate cyclase